MRYSFYLLFYLLLSSFAFAHNERDFPTLNATEEWEQPEFQDGKDYFSYQSPLYLSPLKNGKVLIQFFFDYDCRVCSAAQDILNLYSQLNQEKVILREYPVATTEANVSANIFYTLQSMQAEDVSNKLLFESAEKKRYTELSQFSHLLAWLAEQEIDTQQFQKIYSSVPVRKSVLGAIQMTEEYGVFTYPYVIINGKYVLTASTLYNDDYSFAVLDFLIHKIQLESVK
ncbi:thiol:disulfide interchange protein DsbA/DsbL [Haemophilus haemoglobinophilus]|nr:thiol:disulfide interchange protein DsbA/DsbL [Canicola haemoglobinophilus]